VLPFALGPVTIRQDEQSFLPGPSVPVEVRCSRCGASTKTTAVPWDEDQLIRIANGLMRNFCPANGHGAWPI
jgi:hypothetical protein